MYIFGKDFFKKKIKICAPVFKIREVSSYIRHKIKHKFFFFFETCILENTIIHIYPM